MKVTESPAVMLLAVLRDGTEGTGKPETCGLCGRFKVEFVTSPGLREKRGSRDLEERAVVCVNADTPCLLALRAKSILGALQAASR